LVAKRRSIVWSWIALRRWRCAGEGLRWCTFHHLTAGVERNRACVRMGTMTRDIERLRVVSVNFTGDHMVTDETGTLVDKYTVVLGLSRRWTMYELAELLGYGSQTAEFFDPGADKYGDMWLGVKNTTVDEIQEQLPRLQDLLAEIESQARVIEQAEAVAGEAHAAAAR
jgi:hypothetical protein